MTVIKRFINGEWTTVVVGRSGEWDTAQVINAQTSDYTLLTADAGKMVTMDSSGDETFTVDDDLALLPGQRIDLLRKGTGEVTVVASSPVVVNGTPGLRLRARWSAATLYCDDTDEYVLLGDLKA